MTVPAATLALSCRAHHGARADAPARERVGHAELARGRHGDRARVPYPPGAAESMPWEGTPPGPTDMASISDRATVQFLVEYRAACTWATFWLFALGEANAPALASATAVLQDVPHWPTQRAALDDRFERTAGWNAVAPAAAARDAGPVRALRGLELRRGADPVERSDPVGALTSPVWPATISPKRSNCAMSSWWPVARCCCRSARASRRRS